MKKLLAVVSAVLLLTGCATVKTQIAYTVYPVGFLIERLTGNPSRAVSVQQDMIVQRAQLKENYAEILADSAVFFYVGQLEPYRSVYAAEINAACSSQIDLSAMNAVYDFERYMPVYAGDDVTYVESRYYNDPVMDSIDTDVKDLYLWTDPIAMLSMAKDIRDWLLTAYPEDKEAIEDNFQKLETDLINLDAQFQALATANQHEKKEIKFVSMTASFGNWQKTYGFQVYPVILSKYGVLPNDDQLAVIEKRIQDDEVRYIVYEPNMTADMTALFNRLEDDLHLTRVELSNLSSLTEEEDRSGKDYLSIMYENLSVLETMREPRQSSAQTVTAEAAVTAEEEPDAEATAEPE
ncbi:MAG: zinc ABC transporter substrate-binding protein [Solobacterium sp.]|nr:zinc ABC transporter substrate-binding protein [Solobacterium sp.]